MRVNLRPPLPGSLLLGMQAREIAVFVADCTTEEQVRELVQDLKTRILDSRRRGIYGPTIVIAEVDADRVVRDMAGHTTALPLLSAALAEVWEQRDGDILRADRYVEIGGLASAVERLGGQALAHAGESTHHRR